MAAVFGSATIANAPSKGNTLGAQDMVGTTAALRADSNFMQNGHIGADQDQVVTPPERAALIAADGTPAIGNVGDELVWAVATGTWGVAP
jgi:hypothetical protein